MEEKQKPKSERAATNYNLKILEEEARRADNHEAYRIISQGDNFRLGISITISEEDKMVSTIEFIFSILKYHSEVEKKSLEKALKFSDTMINRGYSLFHQDDGWIICEKRLDKHEIRDEIEFMKNLVIKFKNIGDGS